MSQLQESGRSNFQQSLESQTVPLWEEAIGVFNTTLTKDEKKKIGKDHQQTSLKELLDGAEKARKIAEERPGQLTDKIRNIFEIINRYATVGDIMIQYNPTYTALAWGGFRFLLLFRKDTPPSSS
ncbi:hypothetical protein K440DRAFT_159648 [Wilcoxina mikolae CBS 423.85]|nr:hypothetical protein K440DRAFT_159648 [Wilcoxina mikolae CBS 423.85]